MYAASAPWQSAMAVATQWAVANPATSDAAGVPPSLIGNEEVKPMTKPAAAMATVPPLTKWYWQLSGKVRTVSNAPIYDIDIEENTADVVSHLHTEGHIVIGYFSAGTWENHRGDSSQFPASVIGRTLPDWPEEKYLDIRSPIVRDQMAKRMDSAKAKGFDGLEPDNVDGFENKSGFPLTKLDQIDYNRWLATAAHQRGMIVALKNTPELVSALVSDFDFSIAEESFKYNATDGYRPFIERGKAVLAAEFGAFSASKCTKAKSLKFSLAFFNLALNGKKYQPC
jgi:hypothetical protein